MKKKLVLLLLLSVTLLYSYSQKVSDVVVSNYKYYVPNGSDLVQTKNGLTVEIIPLDETLCPKYPEMFSFNLDAMPSDWSINLDMFYPITGDGKRYCYPFSTGEKSVNVYKIKITNNTGHIIKMSDARIYMRVEGEDPIKPINRMGDATLVDITPADQSILKMRKLMPKCVIDNDQESLIYNITSMWQEWDRNRKRGLISFDFPIAFPAYFMSQNKKAFKLINDVNVEILPDDTYSGILLFPRLITDDEINIKLYEFSTKTDAAGNVTEKSNFDYKLKMANGTMYWNRNTSSWVPGTPPQKVEYYDKKLKKWFYGIPEKK